MEVFGGDTQISLGCDLTTQNEKIIRGRIREVYQMILQDNLKCEFVLVIDNKKKRE